MSAATDQAKPAESEGKEPSPFVAALAMIRTAERAYLRSGRVTASSREYRDAAAFCDALLGSALAGARLGSAEVRARFFAWATDAAPGCKLLPVLACTDHLARGDIPLARMYAERALGINQNDLHAQALYRHCYPGWPDPDLHDRFCANPFDKLETQSHGKVYFCCPAWLPLPIGNLERQSAEEIWNSPTAQDIRQSILDGSYRYCSRMHCPKLTANSLPKTSDVTNGEHRKFIAAGQTRLGRGPKRLVFNHDRSCNLSCPSCRTGLIVAKKSEQERMDRMADRVLMPLVGGATKVHITAGGDAFGSAHYRHVLRSISRSRPAQLKLDLQTNGLLMAASWEELELDGLVDRVYVSIDATRPSTYSVVRRGGNFERLLNNLAFTAQMRRAGQINYVRLDFVVQALNFREMPEAVELIERFGFDGLKFQMIRSWNTYSPEAFAWHNIGSPDHPLFSEFLEVLRDPRLQAGFVEFWGFYSVDFERLGVPAAPGAVRSGGHAGA